LKIPHELEKYWKMFNSNSECYIYSTVVGKWCYNLLAVMARNSMVSMERLSTYVASGRIMLYQLNKSAY